MDRRLIDHFVNANLLSRQDMQRIILRASKDKNTLVEELLSANLVHEDVVAQQIAKFYRKEPLSAQGFRVDPMALNLITGEIARRGGVLPFAFNESQDQLFVAVFDMEACAEVLDILQKTTGVAPEVRLAPKSWVIEAIEHYYFKPAQERSPARTAARPAQASAGSVSGPQPSLSASRDGRSNASNSLRASFAGEPSHPKIRAVAGYDKPIDDLDDFLNEPPRSREVQLRPDPTTSFGEMSGLGAGFWEDPNSSKWSFDDPEPSRSAERIPERTAERKAAQPRAGFDLFDEPRAQERPRELTLQEIVERQQERLAKLSEELQRQREVIQVMADLLVEARVINARDLKQRLRDKRGS